MSPRRSSRARTTQPPSAPPHTNSSTSTTSLNHGERSTRSNHRQASPRETSVQRSDSIDDADSNTRVESLPPRRSRRGNDPDKEHGGKPLDDDEELTGGEEEITRCICGNAEYPGPPLSIRDQKPKEGTTTEDMGNFFIQCDNCHVWQHAGCMGLTDEDSAPENYYCEQCRPQSHRIVRGSHGPRSSIYLPALENGSARSSPLSSGALSTRRDSKDRQADALTKRRATMNSRGAYDEDEMLRRAIEESRGEIATLGKRGREEEEDSKQNAKRQRTTSTSPSSMSKRSRSPSQGQEQEDGSRSTTNGTNSVPKARSAAARTNREKEIREQQKEQAAAQRAEAASKRNARSERRRLDESPPPTPTLSPSKPAPQPSRKTNGNDPSPSHKSSASNLRKTGRPTARRGRLGRNQYTRDLPLNGSGDMSDTPLRDTSHDPNSHGHSGSPSNGNGYGINGESGRSSKAKTHPARTSMNEMKRRVAAILEFVGRMQSEKERTTSSNSNNSSGQGSAGGNTPNGHIAGSLPTAGLVSAIEKGLQAVNGDESGDGYGIILKDFNETMASGEMMEALTRELVGWQSVYGKYGEK